MTVSKWAISKMGNDHHCMLGAFFSVRWFVLSSDCEWSTGGRSLEEPVKDSREVGAPLLDGMATLSWAALAGDGPRIRRFFCRRADILVVS